MNKYSEAMDYLNESLAIKQKTTSNEDTDTQIAFTKQEIGVCLRKRIICKIFSR